MRKSLAGLILQASLFLIPGIALAQFFPPGGVQAFPPGTFSIDGVPITCGPNIFVLTPQLPDSGSNDGFGHIYLNPIVLNQMPHVLRMFAAAHECGHSIVGANETAADCWAIRTGRDQGWFPPQGFQALIFAFRNNPGDLAHPPGQVRVRNMMDCYNN